MKVLLLLLGVVLCAAILIIYRTGNTDSTTQSMIYDGKTYTYADQNGDDIIVAYTKDYAGALLTYKHKTYELSPIPENAYTNADRSVLLWEDLTTQVTTIEVAGQIVAEVRRAH